MPPLRVLLVEDDATVADVIRGLLSARGHEVVHAGHALAALREISAGDFDVGLLDLDLPGLSGFELAQHLRNQGYMLPLLAVTARTDPDLQQQVEAAGIGGFLRKPVTGELLLEAIAGSWGGRMRRQGLRPCTCCKPEQQQPPKQKLASCGMAGWVRLRGRCKSPPRPSRWRLCVRALAKQCFASKAPSPM